MRKLNFAPQNLWKTLAMIFLFLAINTSEIIAETLYIYIKVDNAMDREMTIYYHKTMDASEPSLYKIDLGPKGDVKFQLELDAARMVNIEYQGKLLTLFIKPTDELSVYFDANDIRNSLKFEGEGSANNNFLANFYREFPQQKMTTYDVAYQKISYPKNLDKSFDTHTPDQFMRSMKTLSQEQAAFFEKNSGVDPAILDYLKMQSTYENATHQMMFYVLNNSKWDEKVMTTEMKKWKTFKFSKLENETYRTEQVYKNFLKANMLYSFLPNKLDHYDILNQLYDHVELNFKKRSKYYLQSELMLGQYDRTGRTRLAVKHFDQFYENALAYPEYAIAIIDAYGADLDFTPRMLAPDFEGMLANGNKISLGDYHGQVVYVSFWATWCKPCLQGFKKSELLRKDLQEMGIVLLNVSLDKEEAVWRKTMAKQNIIGENMLVEDIDEMKKLYNLSTLPAYHIVGKDGRFNFLSNKASRNLLEEFKGFLKKK